MATAISIASLFNSGLRLMSESIYGGRARKAEVKTPLFVIGHWRTGTTLLHELLVKDERFAFPTTYQCMAPHHFLLTGSIVTNWFNWLLPATRPMDNMPLGFARPQEDEFALVNLGLKSPYLEWAFPNQHHRFDEYLSLEELSESERDRWKELFLWFLRRLSVADDQQLVLKSPTHTPRVRTILEMFPEAKFIYTVRDPEVVIPSTIRTWNRMNDGMALQVRKDSATLERALEIFNLMHKQFESTRDLIPEGHLYELRYEDLIQDPVGRVQSIYEHLNLADFEPARPALEQHVESTRDYKPHAYKQNEPMIQQIREACESYRKQHGYAGE